MDQVIAVPGARRESQDDKRLTGHCNRADHCSAQVNTRIAPFVAELRHSRDRLVDNLVDRIDGKVSSLKK